MHQIVYILGSTRSGTSALRNAIARTRYMGYGEGHMDKFLAGLIADVRRYRQEAPETPGNARSRMEPPKLLRHLFRGYERYLATQVKSDFIIDKTPSALMIQLAPDLNRLHRQARFIHCSRRHVDNVASKLRKFPGQTFRQSCMAWEKCNSSWLKVREELDGNFLEFDFHDLTRDPEGIGRRIADYLELDGAEAGAIGDYLASQRPEATSGHDLTRFLKLSETGWSAEDKTTFLGLCGPLGERLNYGLESYFADPAAGTAAAPAKPGQTPGSEPNSAPDRGAGQGAS